MLSAPHWLKPLIPIAVRQRLRRIGLELSIGREPIRNLRWSRFSIQRRHALPGELVITLASYPARFPTLHRTIASLLVQRMRPDRVILWVPEAALDAVPAKVLALRRKGLDIRGTRDIGSYAKLVPALRAYPSAFLVTVDDDVYYDPRWLEQLVETHDPAHPAILCCRAHRPGRTPDGAFGPYGEWERDVQDAPARTDSEDIIPTGVGGVLYPPGSLHPDVLDEALFRRLCPTTDDFWFFWMARRAGSVFRKVGGRFRYLEWPGSQDAALHAPNLSGGYDRQIAALMTHFGVPRPEIAP